MAAPPRSPDPEDPADDDLHVEDDTVEDEGWLRRIAKAPPVAAPEEPLPGSRIAERYLLLEEAGRGGMGIVYRAMDEGSGVEVAVKVLTVQGEAAQRFVREVRLLSELRHPSIVSYHEHGALPDGRTFLVMEWLDGEDLSARLRRGPMPIPDVIALLVPIAAGLAFAHGRGVVHRDIKPHNLFLRGGSPADARILDFGLARAIDGEMVMTKTGVMLGTPAYMSPEQIMDPRSVGTPADIFSLGCVLFQCLSGRPPFVAKYADQVMAQILRGETPKVEVLRPEVPQALAALLSRMLQRAPSQRPANGAALLRELGPLLPTP